MKINLPVSHSASLRSAKTIFHHHWLSYHFCYTMSGSQRASGCSETSFGLCSTPASGSSCSLHTYLTCDLASNKKKKGRVVGGNLHDSRFLFLSQIFHHNRNIASTDPTLASPTRGQGITHVWLATLPAPPISFFMPSLNSSSQVQGFNNAVVRYYLQLIIHTYTLCNALNERLYIKINKYMSWILCQQYSSLETHLYIECLGNV